MTVRASSIVDNDEASLRPLISASTKQIASSKTTKSIYNAILRKKYERDVRPR